MEPSLPQASESPFQLTTGSEVTNHSVEVPMIPLKNITVDTESDTVGMVPISGRAQTERGLVAISGRRAHLSARPPQSECCLLL
jgi:hypothetical protein